MASRYSRRDFLKLGLGASLSLAFRDFPPCEQEVGVKSPSFSLGRTVYSIRYYENATTSSKELGYYITDSVIQILEERKGEKLTKNNALWFRTPDGWLHSAYVQPVESRINTPVLKIPDSGMLVEVTVPLVQAYKVEDSGWKRSYKFYYASTYWVHYAFQSDDGRVWYQLYDERLKYYHYALAENFRPVTKAELTPISPGVLDKRIEIDLSGQALKAFEGSKVVYSTRIATGYYEGDTPKGEFKIERKQPTRHMAAELDTDYFDLPGVPWVCYIFWNGVSIHGTYWHNNYGTPQSHGCINLTPNAAKWIYRWTDPHVPLEEDFVSSDNGTQVIIY